MVEGTTAELANDFRGWHPDVHAIIQNIDTPFKWALMVRRPMGSLDEAADHARWETPAIQPFRSWAKAASWRSRTPM